MTEKFINDVIMSMSGDLSDQQLKTLKIRLSAVVSNYDITVKETAVVPYEDPLPECYKAFMITKKIEGMSDKTLELYRNYLEDMIRTIRKPVEKITANDCRVYLYMVQQQRGISNRSLDSRRSIMSSFFSWAAAEQYIGRNPMVTIKPIKYEAAECKPLTDLELEQIRQACKDARERAIVEFFYSTGCRVTELTRIDIADINFVTNELTLFGKGNKHRASYLTAKAALLLRQYLATRDDDSPAVFVSTKAPHNRLTRSGVEKIISNIGERAGVNRLHPHLIRHTTATNALQHGMDVTQVQQLLGHASLDTTMIYAKVDASDVKRNHKKFIA